MINLNTISLEHEIKSHIRENPDKFLQEQLYDYKSIFLNKIYPDDTNPRFLPAVFMSDEHAYQVVAKKLSKKQLVNIYDAENKVIIGKSCIVNCCKYGSHEWAKANTSIESILDLAANVAMSEIIQVPTMFPIANGNFQILTGHRRFFAMIFAYGVNGAAHFKVYRHKPVLQKTKQFQENASREDLPQYGKLRAFQDAMLEIGILSNSRKALGSKALTVKDTANILGISMGSFDNYNVLTRYPCIIDAYENGYSISFVKMKKITLKIENDYKNKNDKQLLNINDKKSINSEIANFLNDEPNSEVKKPARPTTYKLEKIQSPNTLKQLLTVNIMELDTGINWETIDWNDPIVVNNTMKEIVAYLNDSQSE